MARVAYLLAAFLALTGCFLAGPRDGFFRVVGSAPADSSCHLIVVPVGSKSAGQARNVSGKFRESFVIGPSRTGHSVSLYCGRLLVASRVVKYGQDVAIGGEVVLVEGAH